MMFYLVWLPLAFAWYFAYTWFVFKNNLAATPYGMWFWIAAAFGAFPLWILISRYSKDIMFDGMLYDIVLFLGCAIGAGVFTGKIATFNTLQWSGFFLIMIGLLMVKYK